MNAIAAIAAASAIAAIGSGQQVFSDDMSGTFGINWTSAGTGTASFSDGQLYLDNTGLAGQTYAYAPVSAYASPYDSTLSSNPGSLAWSFNMATLSQNPSDTNRLAFVIAADSDDFTSASGYAVRIGGNSPSVDPLTLVYFTGGVNGSTTTIASGESMTVNSFADVRVTYDASSDFWSLYGTTGDAFGDPGIVASLLGSGVNSSGTGSPLDYMGVWSSHSTAASQDRIFDNVTVTAIPEPSTYAAIMGLITFCVVMARRALRDA